MKRKNLRDILTKVGDTLELKLNRKNYLFVERTPLVNGVTTFLVELFTNKKYVETLPLELEINFGYITLKELKKTGKSYLKYGLFECTDDYQNTNFKVGDMMTEYGWKEWFIADREMSDSYGTRKWLKKEKICGQELINYIADFYELEIVRV